MSSEQYHTTGKIYKIRMPIPQQYPRILGAITSHALNILCCKCTVSLQYYTCDTVNTAHVHICTDCGLRRDARVFAHAEERRIFVCQQSARAVTLFYLTLVENNDSETREGEAIIATNNTICEL